MKQTTIAGYTTRSILHFAAQRGADVEALCATAGLDPILLKTPDQRIPGANHLALWREAVRQTGDENLGLHLGEAFNVGTFGIPGYVLINCQTLGDLIEKVTRYTRLFCQVGHICFTVSDGMVLFECNCDCDAAEHLKSCQLEELRYSVECTFASLLTVVKDLTGKRLLLAAAWFQFAAPANTVEYERIFAAELRFSMPANRLVFDVNCLDWPILSSNAALLALFEQYAEAMLHDITQTKPYSQRVMQAIAQQLTGELPTIDAIARELAMSARQLQRELQAEGTSFQQLRNATRKELALRHLENPTTSIYDIAFLLGFSEPSAFNRAFKRWTGKTPGRYRLSEKP